MHQLHNLLLLDSDNEINFKLFGDYLIKLITLIFLNSTISLIVLAFGFMVLGLLICVVLYIDIVDHVTNSTGN